MIDFYSEEVELKEGVAEFLEYLNSNGVKMCIAFATDIELIKIAVKHCNIEKYFTDILSCAETGKGKDEIKRISTVYIAEGETFLSQLLNV
ncbi:MAG: HAD hydrolase-like protein [Clostridia bacterium]|nr:HAD hydrolase-like protein [Clostridia bacterium]